jgi:uncharacterized membrane protein
MGFLTSLYFPGAAFIEALYPKQDSLENRGVLSISLSLALTPLTGFVLNYTPWGIRLEPILVSIVFLTIVFGIIATFRKFEYFEIQKDELIN